MPRLFTSPRDVDFFNDIAREFVKDVTGQEVYYYSISYAKTMVDELYQESPEKVFEHPIRLPARVTWEKSDVITNEFGHDEIRNITLYVHVRDVLDKGINIQTGDFISYGESFYEVTTSVFNDIVHGMVEYRMGYELKCVQARQDEFIANVIGPTWEGYDDPDAVKKNWYQQRGYEHNKEGPTGDKRDLIERGTLEKPLGGPREVSERGSDIPHDSAFYDEPDEEPQE